MLLCVVCGIVGGARVVTVKTTRMKAWVHFFFVLLIVCS